MSSISGCSFIDTLRKSGLIPEPELVELMAFHRARHGGRADYQALPGELLTDGVITPWQHKMLSRGISNGYFLGKHKLLGRLGAGGMGVVYLAEHVTLQRRVAIKVLDLKNSTHSSSVARFFRESRVTAGLDHPNIVRVYDFDSAGSHHFLVMEYVDGANLQELVERQGPLAPIPAAQYAMQAAAGLGIAHRSGLIHRDVKPANLLVSTQGIVKVTDLGLARAEQGESLKLTLEDGGMLGTADYISPEQAMDSHRVTPFSDVYSLGCTFYFMLLGRPPFPDGSLTRKLMRHQMERPVPPADCRPDVPREISRLCERMLAKDATQRPSADEARFELRDWLQSAGYGSVPDDPRLQTQLPPSKRSATDDTISGSATATKVGSQPVQAATGGAGSNPGSSINVGASANAGSTVSSGSSSLNLSGPPSSASENAPGLSGIRSDARVRVRMTCTACGTAALAPVGPNGSGGPCPKCGATLTVPAAKPSFPGFGAPQK